ncbi:MAG: homoserine kinase [Bacteroidetes bacterium]|nr:homoserine kinase [Bacteroidota bacterium]
MKLKSIKVAVPASVSNVGCGFDVMGFAVDIICDEITVKLTNKKEIKISKILGDNGKLPLDVEKNTCGKAVKEILDDLNLDVGLDIKIKKVIGFGSGLGSSAASAVAGVFAVNKLLNLKLSKKQLLNYALKGEEVASKAIHADNVAPCLYGGFVLIRGYNPVDIINIKAPKNLFCTIIHPQIEIKTSEARKILPKNIPLKKAVTQWGNVGGLIAGLLTNDIELIGRSVHDEVAEPRRAKLIPGFDEIKKAALNSGAVACSISGSGPAIFAFSNNLKTASIIGSAMKNAASINGLRSKVYVSKVNASGPKVI